MFCAAWKSMEMGLLFMIHCARHRTWPVRRHNKLLTSHRMVEHKRMLANAVPAASALKDMMKTWFSYWRQQCGAGW